MNGYEIKARGDKATIYIYDLIGASLFEDGITAIQFAKEIKALGDVKEFHVRINSEGGSVFEARAMGNTLRSHKARVLVDIDGICASAATLVACAGDEVAMASDGIYMIHEPSMIAGGNAEDMRKAAELLDLVKGTLIETYVKKTGKPAAKMTALVEAETWMDASQALELGFVDRLSDSLALAAKANFGNLPYKKIPANLLNKVQVGAIHHQTDDARVEKEAETPVLNGYRDRLRQMEMVVSRHGVATK